MSFESGLWSPMRIGCGTNKTTDPIVQKKKKEEDEKFMLAESRRRHSLITVRTLDT